jgi:hypothetical protein
MANFTVAGRLKNLPDIQKIYMWELYIPSVEELDQDDFVLRVRNVVIPGRTITPIESFFMGTKQFFPGRNEYAGTFTFQIEEFEDQKGHAALHSWQQLIFDYDPNSPTAGQQKVAVKSDLTRDVVLRVYKGDGTKMDKEIVFYSSWPQAIADSTLDYTGSDSVKIDCTFQYDYWLTR